MVDVTVVHTPHRCSIDMVGVQVTRLYIRKRMLNIFEYETKISEYCILLCLGDEYLSGMQAL